MTAPNKDQDLENYESELAAIAIPYGIESLPSIADMQALKAKLFDRLDLALPVPFMALRSTQLEWHCPGIPKVEIAILHTDSVRRERVGLLRAEPGMQYPAHRHGGTEEIYMLSGDLVLEGVPYHSGDYIRSAGGSSHIPAYSETGCMFFFRSSLDDEYPA
jgi:anti-sigma factor ChrR (cupin superfamily)